MRNVLSFVIRAAVAVAIVAAIVALVSAGVFILWNWIAVGVFGAPHISFFQAFGLLLVAIVARNFCTPTKFNVRR